jgi:putative addiction module component (TIGR02574 family)
VTARHHNQISGMTKPLIDFSHLTIAERIQLVEDLWDSVAEAPEVLEITEAQRAELDRRLEAHRADPDSSIPWDS